MATTQQRRVPQDSIWAMLTPPTIWALHFLYVYTSIAVVCARAPTALGSGMSAAIWAT